MIQFGNQFKTDLEQWIKRYLMCNVFEEERVIAHYLKKRPLNQMLSWSGTTLNTIREVRIKIYRQFESQDHCIDNVHVF